MLFRKVAGPMRIEPAAGPADQDFALDPKAGGRMCKNVQVMVKVVQNSAGAKLGVRIEHGPDGTTWKSLAASTTPAPAVPSDKLLVLDSGSGIVGEYIRVVVVGGGAAVTDWAVVEVFEMRKPF
jgi:hypothetical protein